MHVHRPFTFLIKLENDEQFTFDDRKILRLEKSKPILDKFKQWLDQHKDDVLSKSALGKAMTYARNEWSRLIAYLEDGRLEIGNNAAERFIKPFVIGRKNCHIVQTMINDAHCCLTASILNAWKNRK